MKVISQIRGATAHVGRAARMASHAVLVGGPMGVFFTLKLRWLQRRQRAVAVYIEREKELHREHMRALSHEAHELTREQQSTVATAAAYWNETAFIRTAADTDRRGGL